MIWEGSDEELNSMTMAVKKWLYRYREREQEIDDQIELSDRLQAQMESTSAKEITGMPRGSSPSADRLASMIAQKDELEEQIRFLIKQRDKSRQYIEDIVNHLPKADEKAVIRLRYIGCASWTEVVKMMFGRKEGFEEKQDSYLRRTTKLHTRSIENMARYILKEKSREILDDIFQK